MKSTIRTPGLWQSIANWAGDRVAGAIWAGRTRKAPQRESNAYARLMSIGGQRYMRDRPMMKPTPANLRRFSRTVYARRAINRVKNIISGLKWEIGVKDGATESGEIKRQIEVVTNCFRRPNNDDSFQTLIEQVLEDYLVAGGGTIEQELGADEARPLWMWPVDVLSIEVYAAWSGKANDARYAQTQGWGNVGGVASVPLRNDQLIYIRKDPNTDNPFGFGCLETAFNSINRQLAAAEYAGNVAGNGQPENLIQLIGADQTALDKFRAWWRNEIEGQGETPSVGGDELKVHKLHAGTDNALYLQYQEFLLREIATAFELSPYNLGVEQDVNRGTAEVSEDKDWSGAIIPAARNIAAYLNREAIEGKLGFSQIEFRWLGIDRDDEELLANIHATYFDRSVMTPNMINEILGRPRLESKWGDMLKIDMDIAIQAARGVAKDADDPETKAPGKPASKKNRNQPPRAATQE